MFEERQWQMIRFNDPYIQNTMAGVCTAFSAGVFTSLNLLGAGGGRPASAQVVQTANAILSSTWFFTAFGAGSVLNFLGPGVTLCVGVCTYALYVGSLWFFEQTGHEAFPLTAGVIIGAGAALLWATGGYISVAYADERSKGRFIAAQNNIQAFGSILCGVLPVILSKDNTEAAGVPHAFYVILLIIMACAACLALLVKRPEKLRREDGSIVAIDSARGLRAEFMATISVLRDWQFLMMVPAFLPAGSFLIYDGSVNTFQNDLRARALCSFIAVVVQIPCGYVLHRVLDYPGWSRRTRALVGLLIVGCPLLVIWIIEVTRVASFDRLQPPQVPLDWRDPRFGWVLTSFVLIWVLSVMWQYIVPYFIGALTNSPIKLSHRMSLWRGILGAGEALCFGADAAKIPYASFAAIILGFYALGVGILAWLGMRHIKDTCYFQKGEDGVVIPKYVLEEKRNQLEHDRDGILGA